MQPVFKNMFGGSRTDGGEKMSEIVGNCEKTQETGDLH